MSSLKRLFDVAGACAGLVVFAPVMALVAVAIFADDGGPVLFRQARLGYRRRPVRDPEVPFDARSAASPASAASSAPPASTRSRSSSTSSAAT